MRLVAVIQDAKTATMRIRAMSAPKKGYDRWPASIVE
jgi:hypothetical protein